MDPYGKPSTHRVGNIGKRDRRGEGMERGGRGKKESFRCARGWGFYGLARTKLPKNKRGRLRKCDEEAEGESFTEDFKKNLAPAN